MDVREVPEADMHLRWPLSPFSAALPLDDFELRDFLREAAGKLPP